MTKFDIAYDYFTKAHATEDNILFLFWRIVSKFYMWLVTHDLEHIEECKLLLKQFENLSQFNVNIKWIYLQLLLFEYQNGQDTKPQLQRCKDVMNEIKSLNLYLSYIAKSEIYYAISDPENGLKQLHECIKMHPNKVYGYIR